MKNNNKINNTKTMSVNKKKGLNFMQIRKNRPIRNVKRQKKTKKISILEKIKRINHLINNHLNKRNLFQKYQ